MKLNPFAAGAVLGLWLTYRLIMRGIPLWAENRWPFARPLSPLSRHC